MAEALVSIAAAAGKVVGQQLAEVVGEQLSQFACATRELEKLSLTFQSITAVLDDAESRQVGEKPVQLWLSRLRLAAYDVEDLLVDASNHAVSRFNVPRRIIDRCNVARRIKEIRERLDQINAERNGFGFSSSPQGRDQRELERSQQRVTTSLMDESEMVIGREDDKETLVSRLVSESSTNDNQGQVQVVSIVGIGGLGKTTLARQIYHDAKVRDRFDQDLLYWVCVSDVFDVIRLTKAILEQVKGSNNFPSELDALQKELLEALRGKRFLLVLDDVWNENKEEWKRLWLPLNSGAQGSRILITTRSQKVAETMNATHIHHLKGLSTDDSWELFRINAFAGKQPEEYLEFENVGREIVNNCNGVPLSIKVIGSAMYFKKTVADWQNVLDSKIWSLRQARKEILPALLLTYCHLPAYLKQCFAYCSVFPKDWNFLKNELVSLWVAQGFIQSEGDREKEHIGDEYFDELVGRSMFQEIKEDDKGKIICKMHDLLHDLAEFIAKDEIFTFISNSEGGKPVECSGSSSDVRHAYLYFSGSDDKPSKIPIAARRVKKLRTLWLHGIDESDSGIIDLIHEARFLRALYFPSARRFPKGVGKLKHLTFLCLTCSKIVKLPDAIGKMQQLRYLDLSDNENIVELPESVGDLRNLHTLNLSICGKLEKLPRGIGGMVSLRELDLSGNSNLVELPESASDLRNLHTLNLSHCYSLKKLPKGIGRMDSLRYLNLSNNSKIVELPESVSDLRNLHTLNLNDCKKLEKLPRGIGGMVSLRHLEIEGTDSLEYLPEGLGRISGLRSLSKFIVGGGDEGEGCGIDELQPLNSLQGTLQIEHLERVSSREEAEKAELWKKQHLCSLVLSMLAGRNDDVETERIYGVLEGLQPHESLEELKLAGFTSSKLPSWMDGLRLVALQELMIEHCEELRSLPEGLTQLPSLEQLDIRGCVKLESLPEGLGQLKKLNSLRIQISNALTGLPDSVGQLESLESFSVSSCQKLQSVPDSLGQLKKLKSLDVGGCDVLRCLPESVGQLALLESLSVRSCKKLESLPNSLGQLRKLTSLEVGGSELLRCLPDSVGQLESLEYLQIRECQKLESLPVSLGRLKKLEQLVVDGSEVLRCLPDSVGQLESLKYFHVRSCKKLESLPNSLGRLRKLMWVEVGGSEVLRCLPDSVGQLESLEYFHVRSCKKLESLPNSLGQLRKLKTLYVGDSEVLKCLPDSVGQLESLENLFISACPNLESLPDSLGRLKALRYLEIELCEALASLPQGLRDLSLRQELTIFDCPLLRERCKREGGVDWPNISHIPNIHVYGQGATPLDDADADEGSEEVDPDLDSDSDSGDSTIGAAPLDDDAHEGSEAAAPGSRDSEDDFLSIDGEAEQQEQEQEANEHYTEVEQQEQEQEANDHYTGVAMDLPLDDDASADPEEVAPAAKMDLSVDDIAQEDHAVSPGSQDDRYFDAESNWLESDSDDEFHRGCGDFSPSSGSTPGKRRSTTPIETSVGNKKNKIT